MAMCRAIQRPIELVRDALGHHHPQISAYTPKCAWRKFPVLDKLLVFVLIPVTTPHCLRVRMVEDPLGMLSPQHDKNSWYRDTVPLQLTRLGILDTNWDVLHCLVERWDQVGE